MRVASAQLAGRRGWRQILNGQTCSGCGLFAAPAPSGSWGSLQRSCARSREGRRRETPTPRRGCRGGRPPRRVSPNSRQLRAFAVSLAGSWGWLPAPCRRGRRTCSAASTAGRTGSRWRARRPSPRTRRGVPASRAEREDAKRRCGAQLFLCLCPQQPTRCAARPASATCGLSIQRCVQHGPTPPPDAGPCNRHELSAAHTTNQQRSDVDRRGCWTHKPPASLRRIGLDPSAQRAVPRRNAASPLMISLPSRKERTGCCATLAQCRVLRCAHHKPYKPANSHSLRGGSLKLMLRVW